MKKIIYIGCSLTYISLVVILLYVICNMDSIWQDTIFAICFPLSIVLFFPFLAFCGSSLDGKISKVFVILLSILGCAEICFLLLTIVIGKIYFLKNLFCESPAITFFSLFYSISIIVLWLIPAFITSEKVKTICLTTMLVLIVALIIFNIFL